MENLESCPFCRIGSPELHVKERKMFRAVKEKDGIAQKRMVWEVRRFRIRCGDCGCGTAWMAYKEDAVSKWNQRIENMKTDGENGNLSESG